MRIIIYLFIAIIYSILPLVIIMDFPVLYKRNPTLNVWTIWTIKVVTTLVTTPSVSSLGGATPSVSSLGIASSDAPIYIIRVTEGEFGGKQEIHDLETTTNLELACRSAQSEWNNKKEKEMYTEAMDIQHLVASLYPTPKNNEMTKKKEEMTQKNEEIVYPIRPMMPQPFSFAQQEDVNSDVYKIPFPCHIQPKLNGVRCIAIRMHDGTIVMESRKGRRFDNFEDTKKHLHALFDSLPAGTYIDGELCSSAFDFETLIRLVTLKQPTIQDKEKIRQIEYHVYDLILGDTGFENRYLQLLEYFLCAETYPASPILVKTVVVYSVEEIRQYHAEFISAGYKGTMVRAADGPYEANIRSKYLQKYIEN
jgi:ATP-dependent DNA ligase